MVHVSHLYSCTDSNVAANNRSLKDFGREDFQILSNLLHVHHAAALCCLMSFAVLAIQAPKYLKSCIPLDWCHHLCWCLSHSFGCTSWAMLFSCVEIQAKFCHWCLHSLKQFLCLMYVFPRTAYRLRSPGLSPLLAQFTCFFVWLG